MYNFKTRNMLIRRDRAPIDEVWMKVCENMEVNHKNYAWKYLILKARYKIEHKCNISISLIILNVSLSIHIIFN